jgi:hypothetical protein
MSKKRVHRSQAWRRFQAWNRWKMAKRPPSPMPIVLLHAVGFTLVSCYVIAFSTWKQVDEWSRGWEYLFLLLWMTIFLAHGISCIREFYVRCLLYWKKD